MILHTFTNILVNKFFGNNLVNRFSCFPYYIEGTSDPDLRVITCTSLMNKLYVFRTHVFIHIITGTLVNLSFSGKVSFEPNPCTLLV